MDQSTPKSAVRLAIGGMSCVACARAITDAVSELEGVSDLTVNQVGKSASAVVAGVDLVESIVTVVEDIGYECKVISVTPIGVESSGRVDKRRTVAIEFQGMKSLPKKIEEVIGEFKSDVTILESHTSDPPNVLRINYTPSAPHFTIRTIISVICTATSASAISVWHAPSSDEVAQQMYRKEQRKLLFRLVVAVMAAIPIFIIGIVYMSLLKADNPGRIYFERPVWVGQVARGQWVLFIISTPVMFYAAEDFHRRSLQELWLLWKPGSQASWATRFLRFGSMNLLISLGVSVAYFSSIAELTISASRAPNDTSESTTYFDSVAFLTMFLLIGRFIEAFSKHQAANAITLLGKLRSSDALLLSHEPASPTSSFTQYMIKPEPEDTIHPSITKVERISVDLLEVGDIVRVPPGATPPADGTIVSLGVTTNFDESSLTGESRNVMKTTGDQAFVGTINKLRMVDMKVDAIDGETMLEQIIEAVFHGQTKRAPIERIVDMVTAYFVPVVTAFAILTWIIWLSLGLSGALPANNLDDTVGGWPMWSLKFAISVFVIGCPCGIGLAAPTALLVGSGLAAKYGILARGGGEAFQEASQIDVIVFDKTGTLTEGSEPKVTDVIIHGPKSMDRAGSSGQFNEDEAKWTSVIAAIVLQLASGSSHPLCLSLRKHYQDMGGALPVVVGIDIEELPGCGMKGLFRCQSRDGGIVEAQALLGSETWLSEQGATANQDSEQLHCMKSQGKSIVLFALDNTELISSSPRGHFSIVAAFAISDRLRPEAPSVISELHLQQIETWMISGDNETTALAVAKSVGIPFENVIAGVLPQQKAEKIRWLQSLPRRNKRNHHIRKERRKVVAMVGDGINDAPALTAADVGIAMGSGSDIALSSADFVLLSSNLRTLLILTDLSRKVFRRVKFNFAWASVYNVVALPTAAGVIYPAGHTMLSPVWSSLAMALSSTSVVCSSLLLRLYNQPPFNPTTVSKIGTREKKPAVEV